MRRLLFPLVLLVAISCQADEDPAPPPPVPPAEPTAESMRKRREELWATRTYRDEAWKRLGDPVPGDWLHSFPEAGQTFEEYLARKPLRKSAERQRIVLQPLQPFGPRAAKALEPLRAYCQRYFGVETVLAPPFPIPEKAWVKQRRQHDAGVVLEHLAPLRPKDALVYAGVCDEDLCVPDLNFVFGLGDWGNAVGVYSLVRFDGEGVAEPLWLSRGFGLLTHEIGHAFGLRHCIYYRCVMNGANSLAESDGAPLEPCPVCLRKLQHALGFDVVERWTGLLPELAKAGLGEEVELVKGLLQDLEQAKVKAPWR